MALSFDEMKPVTRQQALNSLLALLQEVGFKTTAWQEGSRQRNFVTALAWGLAGVTTVIRNVARGGFPHLAARYGLDDWLDLGGQGWFQESRVGLGIAVGNVVITSDGTTPITPWAAGELVVSDTADGSSGNVYRVVSSGSIGPSDEQTLSFAAVTPGAAANINSTIAGATMYLLTPITGVTARIVSDPATGTWLTTPGTDRESNARYWTRMSGKWATMTYGSSHNGLAYKRWAMEADPTVTDVVVLQGATAADVRVICRTAEGGITGGQIAAIAAYIEDGRRPINDVVSVESASVVSVNVVVSPVVRKGQVTAGAIEAALDAYFEALPIGGKIVHPSTTGAVIFEDLIETLLSIDGVFRARVTTPSADLTLGATEIAVPSYTITVTEVGSMGV